MTDDHALAADSGLRRMQHPACFLGKEPPGKAYLRIYADNKECWCSGLSATNQYQLHCVPPPYIASYILPRFLPAYIQKHPHVELSTHVAGSDAIKQAVEHNEADIGLSRKEAKRTFAYMLIIKSVGVRVFPRQTNISFIVFHRLFNSVRSSHMS